MRMITHPGPPVPQRLDIVPTRGRAVSLTLQPRMPLSAAVAAAMAAEGLTSAYLWFDAAMVARLAYVIPAPGPEGGPQVAWYSAARCLGAGARIEAMGMIVGRAGDAQFLHAHGVWTDRDRAGAMGHLLADQCELAAPAVVQAFGFADAVFDRRPDAETGFCLFRPQAVGPEAPSGGDDFALLRVAPNYDLSQALCDACAALGWSAARAHGIGSLNDVTMVDGARLGAPPTEFLLLGGAINASDTTGPGPDLLAVGIADTPILQGAITRGDNPVLVTAEIILERIGAKP